MMSDWEQSQFAFSQYPALKSVVMFENLGSVLLLVYGFVVGCAVWSGSKDGRKLAKQYLLVRLIGFIGIEAIALMMMSSLPSEMLKAGAASMLGAVIGQSAFSLVWWFYFKKSKRVKNTYGDERA